MVLFLMWVFTPIMSDPIARERPFLAAVVKLVKTTGWLFLMNEAPVDPVQQTDPYRFEEIPRELVNTYPERVSDSSGEIQLDLSQGW